MVKYDRIRINRSEVEILVREVVPWETPVLVLVSGEDRCFPEGTFQSRRPFPTDAQSEYDRIDIKYGADSDNGQSYMAMVYGVGSIGVGRLRQAIEDAKKAPVEAEAPATEEEDPTAELFRNAPVMAEGARAIEQ